MLSLISSLVCVLSLLPSLSMAAAPPILSTLKKPFTLRAATPERWNITVYTTEVSPRFADNVNVSFLALSRSSSKLPQFKLTNGTLTTADGLLTAFHLFGSPIDPPNPIRAIAFGNEASRENLGFVEPTYAAKRVSTPGKGSKLQLIALDGGKLRR